LAFLGYTATAYIFGALALAELVGDKLPKTPSRKTLRPFRARIVLGALSGAALCGGAKQSVAAGAVMGAVGSVAGPWAVTKREPGW
jgi:uncharacterized membrane protein